MKEFDIAPGAVPKGQNELVIQSLLREAWVHLRAEEWEAAERVLSGALGRAPEHPGCLAALAICLAEGQRRFLSAEKLARKAVQVAPRDSEGCYALGVVYARGGRLDEARRWLRRADKLAGGHARAAAVLTELGSGRRPPLAGLSGAAVMAATAMAAVANAGAVAGAAARKAAGQVASSGPAPGPVARPPERSSWIHGTAVWRPRRGDRRSGGQAGARVRRSALVV